MEYYQEVIVALSASIMKNRVKHPLAEKSWWRHIRLVIKLRYIRNHASQIKSYYGTLWGSHGRSFRIHHEAPSGGEITMTWYLICSKSSLPCIPDEKLSWITIRKSWSLSDFHKKQQILIGELHMRVYNVIDRPLWHVANRVIISICAKQNVYTEKRIFTSDG